MLSLFDGKRPLVNFVELGEREKGLKRETLVWQTDAWLQWQMKREKIGWLNVTYLYKRQQMRARSQKGRAERSSVSWKVKVTAPSIFALKAVQLDFPFALNITARFVLIHERNESLQCKNIWRGCSLLKNESLKIHLRHSRHQASCNLPAGEMRKWPVYWIATLWPGRGIIIILADPSSVAPKASYNANRTDGTAVGAQTAAIRQQDWKVGMT